MLDACWQQACDECDGEKVYPAVAIVGRSAQANSSELSLGARPVLTFLSEFGMLFALFAGIILVVAWRNGWFNEHLADEISVRPKDGSRGHWRPKDHGRSKNARSVIEQDAQSQDDAARDGNLHDVSVVADAVAVEADQPLKPGAELDPNLVAEAMRAAQAAAAREMPDYWSRDVIQQRAGWMLFEPTDFLGDADRVFEAAIPGTSQKIRVPLFSADRVRAVERTNTLIELSRRKVVQARWDRRAKLSR